MIPTGPLHAIDFSALDDDALAAHAQRGKREAFLYIMQRCNQRLFRIARGVIDDDREAEDVVQQAYVNGFEGIAAFRGEASIATWLTRIVLNEAYARLRQRRAKVDVEQIEIAQDEGRVLPFPSRFGAEDPAAGIARAQIRGLLEQAIADLPATFRIVFVMRELEQCTVEETASILDLRAETVKTRLHRARRLLRSALHENLAASLTDAFPFLGPRCARMSESVLRRLDTRASQAGSRARGAALPHPPE